MLQRYKKSLNLKAIQELFFENTSLFLQMPQGRVSDII